VPITIYPFSCKDNHRRKHRVVAGAGFDDRDPFRGPVLSLLCFLPRISVMNPPVHPTVPDLVGNRQSASRPSPWLGAWPAGLSGGTPVGIPRARTPLSGSPTITRLTAPLPVEPRPNFLLPILSAPTLCHYLGQHWMSLRYLGSGRWWNT
jgi:hypothetical protein